MADQYANTLLLGANTVKQFAFNCVYNTLKWQQNRYAGFEVQYLVFTLVRVVDSIEHLLHTCPEPNSLCLL